MRALLQGAATTLGEWFRKWRIEVNPEKSVAILFSRNEKAILPTNITLLGRTIPWVDEVKYLGVTLDKRLNFKSHIGRVRNRAAFYLARLHPLVCKRSKLSLRHKLTLYKTVIRPVMTYASPVFAHTSKRQLYSLQVIQNRFLRSAVGAPYFVRNIDLHDDLEIESVASFMRKASRRYFNIASQHSNTLISTAATYAVDPDARRCKRRPRHALTDPDDPITRALAAAPRRNSQVHPCTRFIPRHRRRRRRRTRLGIAPSTVANRCVYAPRRSSSPTQP